MVLRKFHYTAADIAGMLRERLGFAEDSLVQIGLSVSINDTSRDADDVSLNLAFEVIVALEEGTTIKGVQDDDSPLDTTGITEEDVRKHWEKLAAEAKRRAAGPPANGPTGGGKDEPPEKPKLPD